MPRRRWALFFCGLVLVLASCGGGDNESSTTTSTTGTTTGSSAASGKQVFTSNCGSCHTLGAAGTSGSIGPNLDDLKPDEATVESQVRSGGGAMPSFEGQLTDEEIAAVAKYVAENAG